jgi:hypothetical protein
MWGEVLRRRIMIIKITSFYINNLFYLEKLFYFISTFQGGNPQPRHANSSERFHRQLGRVRPHAVSHHHAAHPRRNTLHDLAGKTSFEEKRI